MEIWETTNNDYGRFYRYAKLEDAAAKCERKCEKLTLELKECQKKLDELRLRSQNGEHVDEPSRRRLREMFRYQSPIPNLRYTGYTNTEEEQELKGEIMKQQQQEKMNQMEQPPEEPRPLPPLNKNDTAEMERLWLEDIINAYRYKQLYPSDYNMQQHREAPPASRRKNRPPRLPRPEHDPGPPRLHPSVNRYTHYKFYGYGGQGAKTSWGHNLPLGLEVRHCKRTRTLPNPS